MTRTETLWNVPVADLCDGDVWTGTDEVTIDDVSVRSDEVRITGRITKGYGRSNRQLSWTFPKSMTVDVRRVGS
jgi:hypothetical protein